MFQSLWMFVDQQEETQLDFFDLCEPEIVNAEILLESQNKPEELNNVETQE